MAPDLVADQPRADAVVVGQPVDFTGRDPPAEVLRQSRRRSQEFGGEGPGRALLPGMRLGHEPPARLPVAAEVPEEDRPREPEPVIAPVRLGTADNRDRGPIPASGHRSLQRASGLGLHRPGRRLRPAEADEDFIHVPDGLVPICR